MAEPPHETRLIYANWARTNSTPLDLSIDFAYSPEGGPPEKVPVRVVMSWEHAKALVSLLDENLNDYEEQAGPIRKIFEPNADADDSD